MEKGLDYNAIGRRIRSARNALKMTQGRLCEKVGISTSHMSHIEHGSTKVSLPTLVALANALGTTVDDLLYDNLSVMQDAYDKEFRDLVSDCSVEERGFIYAAARQMREALKK